MFIDTRERENEKKKTKHHKTNWKKMNNGKKKNEKGKEAKLCKERKYSTECTVIRIHS